MADHSSDVSFADKDPRIAVGANLANCIRVEDSGLSAAICPPELPVLSEHAADVLEFRRRQHGASGGADPTSINAVPSFQFGSTFGSAALKSRIVCRAPNIDMRSLSDHDAYKYQRKSSELPTRSALIEDFGNFSLGELPSMPRSTLHNADVASNLAARSISGENGLHISASHTIPTGTLSGTPHTTTTGGPSNADSTPASGKMFVGGLSWETTQERLVQYFAQFGTVSECQIMCDPHNGRSRGFGFVTFVDPAVADDVARTGPHTLDNRTIDPKPAVPRGKISKRATAQVVEPSRAKKIFVGGLSPDTTSTDLAQFFSHFGGVEDVVLMYDRDTKRPRGFGFVTFTSEEPVAMLCAMHFTEINGKAVEMKVAQPKMPRSSEFPRGGGGGGRGDVARAAVYAQQARGTPPAHMTASFHPGAHAYPSPAYAGPYIVTHARGGGYGPPQGSPVPRLFENFAPMGGGGQQPYMPGPTVGHYAMGGPFDAVPAGGGSPAGLTYAFAPTSPFMPGVGNTPGHLAAGAALIHGVHPHNGTAGLPGATSGEVVVVPVSATYAPAPAGTGSSGGSSSGNNPIASGVVVGPADSQAP